MTKRAHNIPSHVELTVQRPNGTIEIVGTTKFGPEINDTTFARIVAANRDADRGEVLSYRNIREDRVETDAQYAERLAGEQADRIAAHQKIIERTMAYRERDECAHHGSPHEPSHKDD